MNNAVSGSIPEQEGPSAMLLAQSGMENPKAIWFRHISINNLDGRPNPLPHTDVQRAGQLDLPASAFTCNVRLEPAVCARSTVLRGHGLRRLG